MTEDILATSKVFISDNNTISWGKVCSKKKISNLESDGANEDLLSGDMRIPILLL